MSVAPSSTSVVANEPAWVRRASSRVQQDYRVDRAFEQVLSQELMSMAAEAGGVGEASPGGEGEEAAGAASTGGPLAQLLPQALAGGVSRAGGLGLADELARAQAAQQPEGRASRDGGAQAPAGTGEVKR